MNQPVPDVLLEATDIGKSFPGVRALDGVSLSVRAGRLIALLGENGAGKSTLMNVLSGVFPPDSGCLRLAGGAAVRFNSPREAQDRGIGIVHQELNLIPGLSVAENIWLGREPRTSSGLLDYQRINADTAAILQRLDLHLDPTTLVGDLRVGQQQLVEIGKALSAHARVLILDEPTSSLSAHEVEVLFGVVAELKRNGVGLIYITHKFEELARLCDDVVIMRDGRVVGGGPFGEFSRDDIVKLMAGRAVRENFQRVPVPPGAPLLKVENLTLPGGNSGRPHRVDHVSFQLFGSEVLGLFGLVGAGRTELLESIFGLHAGQATGRVFVAGQPADFRGPADAIRAGLAFAPEDRKRDGVVLPMSVAANASLASLDQALQAGLLNSARETTHIQPYLDRFRVKASSLTQPIAQLSGGNQQKVILAKWLAIHPRILLLDEPTRGIDVNAKAEIYAFISDLARSGLGIIVVSSELPEVLALADRILVLCEGRVTAELPRAEATPEKLLHAALPDRGPSSS